ncbi:MAG: hypothetical protein KDA33_02570 [Phycisphaerales bacterium]|nr:hypothetical protein [Phycisphaerales bacterium]
MGGTRYDTLRKRREAGATNDGPTMLSQAEQQYAGDDGELSPRGLPETLRRLNQKIAYQKSQKRRRSALAGRQPTACPDCEASWVGLARRGACPDCGLVYDENTRAWTGRRRARLGTPILITIVALVVAVMYFRVVWVAAPLAILAPLYLGFTIYDFLVTRDGRFIATTPRGVLYRIGSHKTRTIPWHGVVLVEATAYKMPVFKIHHKKRAKRLRINRAIRNCRDGCAFAAAVEDGIKRYAGRPAAPTPPTPSAPAPSRHA